MMINEKKVFDWLSLLAGILFILISFMSFRNPGFSLRTIVLLFAIVAITNGILGIITRNRIKNWTGYRGNIFLVLGILEILVGIILLFNLDVGILALSYVFSIWFIADSIRNLFLLQGVRLVRSGYYWFSLILNVIGIFIGISLFFDPIISMLSLSFLIGLYFLLSGIFYIVRAFSRY